MATLCTAENLAQYKLDPSRGEKQRTLVTLADVAAESIVVETVQLISADDAQTLTPPCTSWAHLAKHLVLSVSGKRNLLWTDEFSPASAKKCRTLGRSTTDNAATLYRLRLHQVAGWQHPVGAISL